MTVALSRDFLNGLNAAETNEVPPFGACRGTGLADELLAGYGAAETDRAMDRLIDDIEAAPEGQPEENWHVGGSEMTALDKMVDAFIYRRQGTMPRGWEVRPVLKHAWGAGGRRDTWIVTVFTAANDVGIGTGDTPEQACDRAESKLPVKASNELYEVRQRQAAFSAELAAACETDSFNLRIPAGDNGGRAA